MIEKQSYKESFETDFSISHNIDTSWHMKHFHFHDVFEIYYAMSDNIKYLIENRIYDVQKGDLFIINNKDMHKSIVEEGVVYERYVTIFKPEYVMGLSSGDTNLLECFTNRKDDFSHKIHLSEDRSHALLSLFKKGEFYCKNSVYGSDIYKKITLAEILLLVNSFYNSSTKPSTASNNDEYRRVELILTYIDQHLSEDLSLDRLSSIFYMSKYHMGFLFKKATGFSVNEYIINRRILKSREFLKQGFSVSEVCEMVGFNNYCHFIRTFKNLVGVSPKQYAKTTQK